jgi:hypothetical protein
MEEGESTYGSLDALFEAISHGLTWAMLRGDEGRQVLLNVAQAEMIIEAEVEA